MKHLENWLEASEQRFDYGDILQEYDFQATGSIQCPECGAKSNTNGRAFRNAKQLSNFKCGACGVTKKISQWKCDCDRIWLKCPLHYGAAKFNCNDVNSIAKDALKRKRVCQDGGVDKPLPKRRGIGRDMNGFFDSIQRRGIIRLAPGSKLAIKFPKHVRTSGEVSVQHT